MCFIYKDNPLYGLSFCLRSPPDQAFILHRFVTLTLLNTDSENIQGESFAVEIVVYGAC